MKRTAIHNSAFTLLEMLVALTLMAILAGALYVSLHVGFRARARAEAAVTPVRATSLALEQVRRDIQSTPPPTGVLAGAFQGEDAKSDTNGQDADTVSFYTFVQDAGGESAIRGIELAVAADPDTAGALCLVRRVTANLLAMQTPTPVEEVLCRGVFSFNLAYFDGTEWLDTWDSTTRDNALPLGVEVLLRLRDSDPAHKPEDGYLLRRVFLLPCTTPPSDTTAATTVAAR